MCCASRAITFNGASSAGPMSCVPSTAVPLTVSFAYPNNTNSAQLALTCSSGQSTGGFAVAGKMLSAVVLALFSFFYF